MSDSITTDVFITKIANSFPLEYSEHLVLLKQLYGTRVTEVDFDNAQQGVNLEREVSLDGTKVMQLINAGDKYVVVIARSWPSNI